MAMDLVRENPAFRERISLLAVLPDDRPMPVKAIPLAHRLVLQTDLDRWLEALEETL
jgi:hypothetical protein